MIDLVYMKEQGQTSNSNSRKAWWRSGALSLGVSIAFYSFLTVVTVHSATMFDLNFWVRPRLFFEGFQTNASLLFVAMSCYLGFAFFLFLTRHKRLQTRRYVFKSRRRLGETEFQGRAWTVVYMVCALCSFFYVGFGFEDFHIPIATEPFFAQFVRILAAFVFLDLLFTFYRVVYKNVRSALVLGTVILLYGTALFYGTNGVWNNAKTSIEKSRAVFRKQLDLPMLEYYSHWGMSPLIDYSIVVDPTGEAMVYTDHKSFSLVELRSNWVKGFGEYISRRPRLEVKVYADRNLPLTRIYELDAETACIENRIFHYMTQSWGTVSQEWWENYSDHYLSLRLTPLECASIRSPPPPPIPNFVFHDTLLIYPEKGRYKGESLNAKQLQAFTGARIEDRKVVILFFSEDCDYGRYIETMGLVFKTARDKRNAYAMDAFGEKYEDLYESYKVRQVKKRYPLGLLDLSRKAYHAAHP